MVRNTHICEKVDFIMIHYPENIIFLKEHFFICIILKRSLWWFGTGGWIKPFLRIIWTLLNNMYVIPTHAAYMALFSPLCVIGGEAGKQLFWSIEETFFGWVLGMVACWSYTANYKVVESGDSLGK